MKASLDERDLILLNAYLDNELSAEERASLEQRLAREPALQAELRSLQATVALLGMAERVRVPHNFTLDPNLYGKPAQSAWWERAGLSALMPLAAMGAAIMVAALCIGAIGLSRLSGGAVAPSVAMEAAAPEQPAAPLSEAPMEQWAPAEEEQGAEAAPADTFAQPQAAAVPPMPTASPAGMSGALEAGPATPEPASYTPSPLPTEAVVGERAVEGNASEQGESSTGPAQSLLSPPATPESPGISALWIVGGAALLLAVGLTIMVISLILIFKRRRREQ